MIVQKLRGAAATIALASALAFGVPAIIGSTAQATDTATMRATTAVNVRTGPSTSKAAIAVLYPGDPVVVTGPSVAGWTPVSYQGRSAWVASAYLTGGAQSSSTSGQTGVAYASVDLNLRSGAGLGSPVRAVLPAGTKVVLTGNVSGSWASVSSALGSGWVSTGYLSQTAAGASAPSSPSTVGTRYATTTLNLWTSSSGSQYAGTVDEGTSLAITGTTAGGRTQVVVNGTARWVTSRYLTSSASNGSSSGGSGEGQATATGSCQASYYDEPQTTADGETFDPNAYTAAHRTLKFNTRVKVTNAANGRSVVVRINDRGPYVSGRCLDLSRAAFASIADLSAGVIAVNYTVLG